MSRYLSSYTYGTEMTLPQNVSKDGCVFNGWYDNSELSGSEITQILTSDYGNKDYYAKWSTDWITLNVSELTVGQVLTAPEAYGFDTIEWEVVGIDKNTTTDTTATHTVTLQTVNLLSKAEDKKCYTYIFHKYSQVWSNSSIRTWLNIETAPTSLRGNFLGSFLKNSNGSNKTGEDLAQAQAFLNNIKTTVVSTYKISGGTTGTLITSNDKVWLPSACEVGSGGAFAAEGNVLDKYIAATGNIRKKTSKAGDVEAYWLRSACVEESSSAFTVDNNGDVDNIYLVNNDLDISPLITLAY